MLKSESNSLASLSESEILSDVKIFKNKLESYRDLLENLLRKKIRIENEIAVVRKTIKEREKHFKLKLKSKLSLECYFEEQDNFYFKTKIISEKEGPIVAINLSEIVDLSHQIEEISNQIKETKEEILDQTDFC